MMKAQRTIWMIVLFFVALLVLWGLDRSGIPTDDEMRRRNGYVLKELINTPEASIRRVVIDHGDEHLEFERRGKGTGHWQMIKPKDVAAEPMRLDALVRNLRELKAVPDAGTVQGDPKSFGLAPPGATVRLYTGPGEGTSAASEEPVAVLELGQVEKSRAIRFVRPGPEGGMTVVDSRLLSAVDRPATDWRQPNMMGVPTFQVAAVKIVRRDPSGGATKTIRAERERSGRWRLTEPLGVPADGGKMEVLLGALSSLRVAEPPKGYVADDVKDLAKYGLAQPPVTVEVTTADDSTPRIIQIGKTVPDQPELTYLRQGGQDDVVEVKSQALSEIPSEAKALRSQDVAEINPSQVDRFEIQTRSDLFRLEREGAGWKITSPRPETAKPETADPETVKTFIERMADLKTSEFLEPRVVPNAMLDPPVMTIRVYQQTGRRRSPGAEESSRLVLNLHTGRQDIARKTLFAQLEGDNVILALPDNVVDVLPTTPLAFRDRAMIHDQIQDITRLIVRRGDRVDEVVPDRSPLNPNMWKMLRPVKARADVETITQVLNVLCNLRGGEIVALSEGNGRAFGLDHPLMEIDWESNGSHFLKIGRPKPRTTDFFAIADRQPTVFTIPSRTVRLLDAEFHDHTVMRFPLARASRVILHFNGRTVNLHHRPPQTPSQVEWVPDSIGDAEGLDLSRINSLVTSMSKLQTQQYIQYDGEMPPRTLLQNPRLKVEIVLGPKDPMQVLRVGAHAGESEVCAAVGDGPTGPCFFLPGPPWNDLIRSGERLPPLPDNVFTTSE